MHACRLMHACMGRQLAFIYIYIILIVKLASTGTSTCSCCSLQQLAAHYKLAAVIRPVSE